MECGYPDGDPHIVPAKKWVDDSDAYDAMAEVMDGTPISPLAAAITAAPRRHDNADPLWKGLCGAGPLGGITQSMLVWFLSCRERFRIKYVLGLGPADKWNKTFGYGNMWHACEEALAKRPNNDLVWITALQVHSLAQCKKYPRQVEEIEKWHAVCTVQFPEYVKYWADHPDVQNRTPLMQEQVFDVPYMLLSGRTVRLRGKFDSVDLIDGGIYLQENKTKGDIDKMQVERQLKFDLQTMMYLIALEDFADGGPGWDEWTRMVCGKATEIKGVRYNVVRRPMSGGVGNIKPHAAKYTKTKTTPAETKEEFYERLRSDYIAADPGYWFFRVRSEVSAKDVQVFRETCLDPLLEQVCDWYEYITTGMCHAHATGLNYRTPFGVYSALEEGGATEYDAYMETGSEAGMRRVEELFTELQ